MRRFALVVALFIPIDGCNRPPAGFYETRTIPNVEFIKRGDISLRMDIVVPINAPSPRPAVLLFHGGGWIVGDRSLELDLARFIASLGYTAATAGYRLCNDTVHHPVPVQDALAAVKFLRSKGADYGVDPQRIAVGGESAGGQLALLLALAKEHAAFKDDSYPGVSSEVSAAIDIYGPTQLAIPYKGATWIVRRFLDCYLGGPPEKFAAAYAEASPLTHVRADAPPILIVHGDRDNVVNFAQARMLYNALRQLGAPCELVRVPGAEHGWGLDFTSNDSMRTLPAIAHFLARVFPGHGVASAVSADGARRSGRSRRAGTDLTSNSTL